MELKQSKEPDYAFTIICVAVVGIVLTSVAFVGIWRWKDEAYRLRQTVEVHELSVATQKREALAARKEAEAAKSETAMCRKAVGHADKAVANLEAALKLAREKGE